MTLKKEELTALLCDLLNSTSGTSPLSTVVSEAKLLTLIEASKTLLLQQNSLVEIDPPVRICGDIHGQFPDLLRLFGRGGFPPTANYLFLGDYVDRGRHNLETIILLIAYKMRFPKNMFLLRGNHECEHVNRTYGFYEECQKRYTSTRIYEAFQDMFNVMPLAGLVGEKILCMHGGLSPELSSLEQLRQIKRPTTAMQALEVDLLWADPIIGLSGYQPSMRGAGVGFGQDAVSKICTDFNLDLIARAHQVVQDGYEFFAGRKLVTLFFGSSLLRSFIVWQEIRFSRIFNIRMRVLAVVFALVAASSAFLFPSAGGGCGCGAPPPPPCGCAPPPPPPVPACGGGCGGGGGYAAPPPVYAGPPAGGYAVAGK
ncbi:unnamed protein product [Caenorhabditis auriculariae]|uniref:Serine/threonine-protein phosphatase n=1 Tax=Caenorhabditis auriculariae TaxID=2777116 RepID=A0A8S1GSX7_9PELO|nr:unnamed protein product [Caenorhabditis auriculariae]